MSGVTGTYALLLTSDECTQIDVGALGTMKIQRRDYVYVGSAFGTGGLRARVERHARGEGALHWHVDYLRAVTTLDTVWYTCDDTRRECAWARLLQNMPGACIPMDGFGASDCSCLAHLVSFEGAPTVSDFRQRLQAACPTHGPVESADRQVWIE